MKKASAPAPRRPRGRPRSFDRAQALDRAMEVFWEKGFEAASIAELTDAMGINPPSLYAAFGDKEALFLEAVERYVSRRQESCDYCGAKSAREAVHMLLTYMADELGKSSQPRGCLMLMAVNTTSGASPRLQAAVAKLAQASQKRLRERIEHGIEDGELPAGTDAAALAGFYGAIMAGMAAAARGGASRKTLMGTVDMAMRAWPEAPAHTAKSRKAATAAA